MFKGLLAEMATALRMNLLLTLVFAVAMSALPFVTSSPGGAGGSSFVFSMMFLYFVHRQVLFGTDAKFRPPAGTVLPKDSIGQFFVTTLFFTALTVLPALLVAYLWAKDLEGEQFRNQLLGMALLVLLPWMWLLFAAIGTLLPAAASRVPFSLGQALRAGRKSGLRVAVQLAVFPGLAAVALLALVNLGAGWIGPLDGVTLFTFDVGVQAVLLIPSLMTVVILVRAFRTAHPVGQGALQAEPLTPQTPS